MGGSIWSIVSTFSILGPAQRVVPWNPRNPPKSATSQSLSPYLSLSLSLSSLSSLLLPPTTHKLLLPSATGTLIPHLSPRQRNGGCSPGHTQTGCSIFTVAPLPPGHMQVNSFANPVLLWLERQLYHEVCLATLSMSKIACHCVTSHVMFIAGITWPFTYLNGDSMFQLVRFITSRGLGMRIKQPRRLVGMRIEQPGRMVGMRIE